MPHPEEARKAAEAILRRAGATEMSMGIGLRALLIWCAEECFLAPELASCPEATVVRHALLQLKNDGCLNVDRT